MGGETNSRAKDAALRELERGVSEQVFSGAQAAWTAAGGLRDQVANGTVRRGGGARIEPQTLFDIASLTKPFVASAALRLVARGELALESRLEELVPGLGGAPTGRATLEQLLAHEAGFVDWRPLFPELDDEVRGTRAGGAAMTELVLEVPALSAPGAEAVYSDLGFIVLGHALELVTGDRLEEVVEREVSGPLGLSSVHYRPITRATRLRRGFGEAGIAATEQCPWRDRMLQGEVHDDNCWAMGGVAGHAGLFANAADVAKLGEAWLDSLEGDDWLPCELARSAIARRPLGRGLGWDFKSEQGSSAGELLGSRTFGHLGFTGCSLWVDPDQRLSVGLLTNRVHPSRHDESIREFRPVFHDALVGALAG